MPATELLVLALAAMLGSFAQSATGFGVALPVAPAVFAMLQPVDAALTVAAGSLMHNLLVLMAGRADGARRSGDAMLLATAAAPGLVGGVILVGVVPTQPFQLIVGVMIVVSVILRLHMPGPTPDARTWRSGVPTGFIAGLLTTTVGINGPPLVFWLRPRCATLAELRNTLAPLFLILNIVAIVGLMSRGASVRLDVLLTFAASLGAGHVLAVQLLKGVSREALDRALVAILLAAASASIVAGTRALT